MGPETARFMSVNHFCSYRDNQVFNIPIGGKVPDLDHTLEDDVQWTKGRAVSTLHHTGEHLTLNSRCAASPGLFNANVGVQESVAARRKS